MVGRFVNCSGKCMNVMGDVITYCGYLHHCKKLEVDLTPKMSSQLQCGFIQVQVVVHLLLQGFRVTPLVQ